MERRSRLEMSSRIPRLLEAIWGLLVEDGSLAVGIVLALAATWLAAMTLFGLVDQLGWFLTAMLLALFVANLYWAAHQAKIRGDGRPG
jgi:hypothetical protein